MSSYGRSPNRLPSLDGIRAFAVLEVFVYHVSSTLVPGGWAGVDVFFVLSGFLITTLLLDEHERSGRIGLGGFWARRAIRLLPALVTVLLLVLAVGWWKAGPGGVHNLWVSALSGLGYFANFRDLNPAQMPLLGHLWSLSLEEQFYLTWPIVLILLLRRRAPLERIGRWLIILALVVSVYGALLYSTGSSESRVGSLPDSHSMGLMLGCALALFRFHKPQLGIRWARVIQWLASAFVLAMAVFLLVGFTGGAKVYGGYLLVSAGTAILLLERLNFPTKLLDRLFEARWAVWLGRRSYEFYLVHLPVLQLLERAGLRPSLMLVIGFPVSLVLSAGIYRLWRDPQRTMRQRLSASTPRPNHSSAPAAKPVSPRSRRPPARHRAGGIDRRARALPGTGPSGE